MSRLRGEKPRAEVIFHIVVTKKEAYKKHEVARERAVAFVVIMMLCSINEFIRNLIKIVCLGLAKFNLGTTESGAYHIGR
jgi:hypothetical protein